MSAWVKIERHGNNHIFRYQDAGSERVYLRVENNGKACFGFRSNKQICSETVLETDTWYQLAGMYDGNTQYIYVNGVLENSRVEGSYDLNPEGEYDMYLGRNKNGRRVLRGYVDNLHVWGDTFEWD